MSKEDCIEVTGTVVEKFPSGLFSVQLDADRTVLAHLAGKLRRNRIRVLAGDRVTMELSPYDLTKGPAVAVAAAVFWRRTPPLLLIRNPSGTSRTLRALAPPSKSTPIRAPGSAWT
jgi:translation initiation factor IF-1